MSRDATINNADADTASNGSRLSGDQTINIGLLEVVALLMLFFFYAGDPAPAVNEAHYLVKAKNFWNPSFCSVDLFAASGKAHTTFYWTFGWLTDFFSLESTAWIGRLVGWSIIACGLCRCCRALSLPRMSSVPVALMWLIGIQHGNLAGEWVVGGIESKVPAYGLVLLGVAELIRRRWSRVWVWFGAAAAFHVLTGGWAVIAGVIAFAVTERVGRKDEKRERFFSTGLFVGGALSLLGLVPALWLTMGATPEDSAHAARIYSFVRIRHHLLPSDFPAWWFVRHGVLVVSLIAVMVFSNRNRFCNRLVWFGLGSALIAMVGLGIGTLAETSPDLAAKLLRYYWFRLTDAIVPLVLSFYIAVVLFPSRSMQHDELGSTAPHGKPGDWNAGRLAAGALLVLAASLMISSAGNSLGLAIPPSTSYRMFGFRPDAPFAEQRQTHADWVSVCQWIRTATPENELLLTPRHQQTFKWYSHRSEVVNWKDVPQDAEALIEWERRFYEIYPRHLGRARVTINYKMLRKYRDQYGVRFMVVDNRIAGKQLPLVKIYPAPTQSNESYSVYQLPLD